MPSVPPIALLCVLAASASAQCTERWFPTEGVAGTAPAVGALASWDPDGPGASLPVLVVGGTFTSAGGVPARNLAAWDGVAWTELGGGVDGEVNALAVLPDGSLVAAGTFGLAGATAVANIARWDGAAWSTLGAGVNNTVWTLGVSRTGALHAGGMFTAAGGATANRIARWDGSAWSSLGTGSANGVGGPVYAIAFDLANNVYVGGFFTSAGGVANRRYIAKWTGSAWTTIGGGTNWTVLSLASLPNGDIVLGGTFTLPFSKVARWDGAAWQPLGSGTDAQPLAFLVRENGDLVAGGHFFNAGGVPASKIARWNGASWNAMGVGMDNYVIALAEMPDGTLYAGGGFTTVDGLPSPGLARWASCRADFNCDGTSDFFDYLDFVQAFDADDPSADFNHDGTTDFFDYLDFVSAFDAGCE